MLDPVMWQVIAGVAQIIAAIFAAITVWQAKTMLNQADRQIQQSVAPSWDTSTRIISPEFDHKKMNHRVDIPFKNTGLGSARNLALHFEAKNGNQPYETIGLGDPAIHEAIAVGQTHNVRLHWDHDKPLDGILTMTYRNSLGRRIRNRYRIHTYLDKENIHNGWCDIFYKD
jgi:hypothetical protein